MSLKEQLENFIPYDEQEERDKEQMLKFINDYDDVLTRNKAERFRAENEKYYLYD